MPQFDEKHVKLCGGVVVWDGITQPEIVAQGAKAGQPKWSLKVVFPPTCPDLAIYDALSRRALQESKWRGQLPAGARMPIGQVQPGEFADMFPGWYVISFKTTLKAPDVYGIDPNGSAVIQDPMQYGRMIYSGQQVDVLAHCYEYDAAGNKGISAGLDALSYSLTSQAPRLAIGGGGVNTGGAFGNGQAAPAAAQGQPAAYGAPAPAAAAYVAAAAPAYSAAPPAAPVRVMLPAANGVPYEDFVAKGWPDEALIAQGLMSPPAPPVAAAPAYGAPAAAAAPAYGAPPVQAHNYLPR